MLKVDTPSLLDDEFVTVGSRDRYNIFVQLFAIVKNMKEAKSVKMTLMLDAGLCRGCDLSVLHSEIVADIYSSVVFSKMCHQVPNTSDY